VPCILHQRDSSLIQLHMMLARKPRTLRLTPLPQHPQPSEDGGENDRADH
jgi:hypothetical protein